MHKNIIHNVYDLFGYYERHYQHHRNEHNIIMSVSVMRDNQRWKKK